MIELRHLTAGYGKTTVLRDVNLDLPEGALTAVIGLNGSGKSTLLKTAAGIIPHSSGEILIDGQYTSDLSRQESARRIAYLSQGRTVPDMTAEQLVLHGRFPHLQYPKRYTRCDRDIAADAMEKLGVSHLADRSLGSLSGGMRQKVYIAMALAQDTRYILLDEPTTYLDIGGQLELMRILRSLADSGKGIIAVMHDLPLAFGCADRIALLREGTAVFCGTPDEVSDRGIVGDVFGAELIRGDSGDYHYRYDLR